MTNPSTSLDRLAEILEQAMSLQGAHRAAYLRGVCGADDALRAEVDSLLAARAEHGDFLSEPTRGAARDTTATMAAPLREGPGTRIGPYKILQLIGEGGFGSVFMAEQEKPVSRKVALKIIKLGMDTRAVIARFEAERQALAMMDHPSIARVLDAGATDTGRPYFVMELCKGEAIHAYCDKNNLSIEERLELFAQVCQAVQHAHTKSIIHRDIKPSNILVSTQDGRPHAKVIDFGIAKATACKLTEKTLFTEHKALIGTPEYMSPEQAEGSLDIDTRTDVYSLGVLLYELLTGTTPFSGKELRSAAYAEIQRIIREVEPPKPSTRLSQNTSTLANVAQHRHTEPKRLGTIVRGELDWIVMKALEKDRGRRYETANGLAMDIRRYLSGEAVVAAPPSTAYRFRKFIRRNRVMVTAGSAVAAALLIGAVAFAWQARVASNQRDIAVQARDSEAEQRKQADAARAEAVAQQTRAEAQEAEARKQEAQAREQEAEARKQAAIAEAVAKFQTDMLAAVDPTNLPKDPVTKEPLKDAVTVVQAMEAAVKVLDDGGLKDQPLVEAAVRATIGRTLRSLGRYDDAEPNLRKALALHREARPAGHPDTAVTMDALAQLLQNQNRLAEAEALFRESLQAERASFPPEHERISAAKNNLALLLVARREFAEAESLLRETLAGKRAALPAAHPDIATHLNNLALVLAAQRKLAEAEPLYRESLEINRAALPAGHPNIANSLNNLASLLNDQNKLAEAEPLCRESLEINRAALPTGHPNIANSMNRLGRLLQDRNRFAEAEPFFRESLSIRRAAFPAQHPEIAAGLSNLASLLHDLNKLAEAEPLCRESLEIKRMSCPAGHPDIAASLNNLASLLQDLNKLAEAEPLYREALEIWRAALPAGHPEIATGLSNLAVLLMTQNRLAEAEPLFRESLEILRAALPAEHPHLLTIKHNVAELYAKMGKTDESRLLLREVLESSRDTLSKDSPELAERLASVGQTLLTLKMWDEAEPLLREALVIREKALPDAWRTFNTKSMLGGALLGQKKLAEAEPLLVEGYNGIMDREAVIPPAAKVRRIPDALERLVRLYETWDKAEPGKGYDVKAAEWQAKLDVVSPSPDQK